MLAGALSFLFLYFKILYKNNIVMSGFLSNNIKEMWLYVSQLVIWNGKLLDRLEKASPISSVQRVNQLL